MNFFKRTILLLLFVLSLTSSFAQKITKQDIEKPSEGKALVYIAKTGAGPLVNFRIYHKDKFLGALEGFKYMIYEVEPGEHLFWAASENRSFIEVNLEPNSVYVISAEGQMGAFVASVAMKGLNPEEFRDRRLFYQIIKNLKKQDSFDTSKDKSENIKKGLERYQELKNKNSNKINKLDASWKFENADKPQKNK